MGAAAPGTVMSSVFYRTPNQVYPVATGGEGMYLYDSAGNRYLDMSGGAAVSLLGHQHPEVIARIKAQLDRLAYAHTAFFTTELQERLAESVVHRFPEAGARAWFTSGGSEANETAVKMAWQYWRAAGTSTKKIIISREHSYHGNTFLTLSLSGNRLRREASAAPLMEWPRIAACYAYREQPEESSRDYGLRVAGELRDAIVRAGADNVAAFICEPVVGASLGAVPPVDDYLAEVRRICTEHDILLIFDEVMCGSGRTGPYFAFEADGVCPDIVTLGKGISAGFQPLAATIANRRVAEMLTEHGFSHGFTYIGHAAALAAGCAVQDVIDDAGVLAMVAKKGEMFREMLSRRFAGHPHVGDIRGRGLLVGMELVQDPATKSGFPAPVADALRLAAMRRGLICYPGEVRIQQAFVPHILLAPPVLAEEEHMATCCDVLVQLIEDAARYAGQSQSHSV